MGGSAAYVGFTGGTVQESAGNTIGGLSTGAGNVISGNTGTGVSLLGAQSTGELVLGNLIGVDLSGTKALGNGGSGIAVGSSGGLGDAPSNITIGGTTTGAGNAFAADDDDGVLVAGAGSAGIVLDQNRMDTSTIGTMYLPNASAGVQTNAGGSMVTAGGMTTPPGVFHPFSFSSGTAPADLDLLGSLSDAPSAPGAVSTAVYPIDIETDGL